MITTSRYSSEKTRRLAKSIAARLETFYVSRGKKSIDDIVDYARRKGESEIIVVEEEKGVPAFVAVIEVSETGAWKWVKRTGLSDYEG